MPGPDLIPDPGQAGGLRELIEPPSPGWHNPPTITSRHVATFGCGDTDGAGSVSAVKQATLASQ